MINCSIRTWMVAVVFIVLGILSPGPVTCAENVSCTPETLQTCLEMAYKLMENDRFTFPTTKADVEDVCNSWSNFLECIEGYVGRCLDDKQKADFKQAVGTILDSVRNLCTDPAYQEQYFQHADCIKRTCTDDAYCGRFYKKMIRQVSHDFDTTDLCCNYRKFNSCVVTNTNAICGSTARDFAAAMLNNAMSFLATRCQASSSSLDSCVDANEVAVAPTFAVTNTNVFTPNSRSVVTSATPSARPQPPSPSTTRQSFTPEPESLAYEKGSGSMMIASFLILSLFCITSTVYGTV